MAITRRSIISNPDKKRNITSSSIIGRGVRPEGRLLDGGGGHNRGLQANSPSDWQVQRSIEAVDGVEEGKRIGLVDAAIPDSKGREWWHEVDEEEVADRFDVKKRITPEAPQRTPSKEELRAEKARQEINHFGALRAFMDDASIEEIWINNPKRVFIARSGVSQLTNLVLTADDVRALIERLLMWGGRRLDLSHPFVDSRLPDGSRLHVAIPEVTAEHWAINIRKHLMRGKSLDELRDLGVCSDEISQFLASAVVANLNILVSGSTGAGKTTLLNSLASAIPSKSRLITVEEVFELQPRVPDCVALQTRPANLQGEGEIALRKLIKEALRMRPTHLVVGEIREAESLDMLIALNSGLPGMATIHANSARDAIDKLQTLPLLAGENITHAFIGPMVAQAVDLVVHVGMDSRGKRRVQEVTFVSGRIESGRVEVEPLFTFREDAESYERGLGEFERVFRK